MSQAREFTTGAGAQTSALAFGSRGPIAGNWTELYDGTSWTTGGSLATGRGCVGGAGTQTSALAFGGEIPSGRLTATEEFTGGQTVVARTVTGT
jgi:hypothetical protein